LGRVHYPLTNRNGCTEFKESDFTSDFFVDEKSDMNPIIIVDRGVCNFVTKVRNIENIGVKLAIIADDKEEDTESLVMADDGTGHSVNIPSFIIRKADADKIKDQLTSET
jgi:hypothetical protein